MSFHLHVHIRRSTGPKASGSVLVPPTPLDALTAFLPEEVLEEQQPYRVGQFWKLAYRHGQIKTDDVIRVDGGATTSVVVAWYWVVLGVVPSLVRYSAQRLTVPVAENFASLSHVSL